MAEYDAAGRWKNRIAQLGRRQIGALLFLAAFLALGVLAARPAAPPIPPPALAAISPAPGSTISQQAALTLRFTQPMDTASVERSLTISPTVPLALRWEDGGATLVVEPSQPLVPGGRYALSLGAQARSQGQQPLAQAAQAAFEVAAAQSVALASPAPGARDVAPDAPISLIFSQPMVAGAQVGAPLATSPLRLAPPVQGSATWVDATTLLFRPAAPLAAGAQYTATLDVGLHDAAGEPLPAPYVWRFSTAAPRVLAAAPPSAAQRVPLGAPLTLTLSQPVALPDLTLTISPTADGSFSQQILPNATQVVTFTPSGGWQPDTAYSASLALGGGAQPAQRWSFRTAPRPLVAGRYPGEGQPLALGQPLRVIFSTPVDPRALERGLRITPPVEALAVAATGNEARISAAFVASGAYTLTLPADLTDANGAALGRTYDLRFRTADAPPSLEAPSAQGHLLHLPAGAAGPQIASKNLSALSAELYRLDADSAVRMLDFGDGDWRTFDPARYGLSLVRGWDARLADTPSGGQVLPLGEGGPPGAGLYYLRLRAVGTLRLDLLLSISNVSVQIRQSRTDAVVWATRGGAPAEGVPVALYREGALVGQGTTGADGLFRTATGASALRLVALAGDGGLAMGEPQPPRAALPLSATLLTDRQVYASGDRVYIGGFVRPTEPGAALPSAISGTLSLRSRATTQQLIATSVALREGGVISTSVALPPAALPGPYMLALSLGSQLFTADLSIAAGGELPTLAVAMPPVVVAGQPLTATLRAESEGLPMPLVPVTWTLALEPIGAPGGRTLFGQGTTGLDGKLSLVLSDTVKVAQPLRYRLTAQIAHAAALQRAAVADGLASPTEEDIGIHLERQIMSAGQPFDVGFLLTTAGGAAIPNRELHIEFARLPDGAAEGGRRIRMLAKSARSRDDGMASASFSAGVSGLYQITAATTDGAGRESRASALVWLTAEGATSWPSVQGETLPLVADQPRYRAGDVAQLLIPAAIRPGPALVLARRGDQLDAAVRSLQPGGVITVPLGLGAPEVAVEVFLAGQDRSATISLPVELPASVSVTLASGAPTVPRSTLPLTITTTDAEGRGVPADVVLAVCEEQPAGAARVVRWLAGVRTDPGGVLAVPIDLPDHAATLSVQAWAAGGSPQVATAQQSIVVTRSLVLEIQAPPYMRAGDQAEVRAILRSASPADQQATVTLGFAGVRMVAGDVRQSVSLRSGGQAALVWRVEAQDDARGIARVVAVDQGGRLELGSAVWDVLPRSVQQPHGVLVDRQWSGRVSRDGDSPLSISIAPSIQALERQERERLAALSPRSAADSAALLQLSAPLSPTSALAYTALAELLSQQGADGGWHLWGAESADPDLTLFALESLAEARRAGLTLPDAAITRGQATLGEVPRMYVAALLGGAGTPKAPPTSSLRTGDLALLLLALPQGSPAAQDVAVALQAQAQRASDGAYVSGEVYGGSFTTTALAARALASAQPDLPLVGEMRRWLAASYGPDGWGDSMRAVRAIGALRGALPAQAGGRYDVLLDGRSLLPSTLALSTTQQLHIPSAQLPPTSVLTATAAQGTMLLGYSAGLPSSTQVAHILREYLDPQTGAPIAAGDVRAGQVVQVRLTVVLGGAQHDMSVEDPLPAGFRLIGAGVGAQSAQWSDGFTAVQPGVYQRSYLIQAVWAGAFAAPPTIVRSSEGSILGLGSAIGFAVIR